MWVWAAVGIGGALGSIARHGVNHYVIETFPFARFPYATMFVNITGSCIYGILAGLLAAGVLPMRGIWRELIFVGVLGGFTTFSTFSFDTFNLLRAGQTGQAVLNVAIQLAAGIGGLYVALTAAERLGRGV